MRLKIKYFYWIIVFGLFACKTRQSQSPINNQHINHENEYPVNFDTLYQKTFTEVFQILKPHESNPDPHFQRRIYDTYYRIGLNSKSIFDRKNMIKSLLNSCGDSLKTSYACQTALGNLQKVNKNEFDAGDIEKIQNLLTKDYKTYYPQPIEYAPCDDLVLLIGFLDIEKSIPKLKSLILPNSNYQRKWEAHLALARLGQKESIDYCIEEINKSQFDFSKLEEVSYIRQPEIIELFDKYLFSDYWMKMPEKEGSETVNYIINLYCKSIKNFPLNLRYGGFTKDDIITARKWVKENKNKYVMNRDTF
jgi:hypothetical protein